MKRRLWLGLALMAPLWGCPNKEVKDLEPVDAGPRVLSEKEPNDRPEQALELSESSLVQASLTVDPSKPDEDWYALVPRGPHSADLLVTGIPGGDVLLELYDADRNRLVVVNSEGEGSPERLPHVGLNSKLFVRVASAKKGSGGSYTFTALYSEVAAGTEAEPNDRAVDANPLPLGESVSGHVGHASDEDWYRVEIPPLGGALPPGESPPPTPPALPSEPEVAAPSAAVDAGAKIETAVAASTALKLEITPVEGVQLELSVLSAAEAPLFQIKGKVDEGLALRNVGVRENDRTIFVVVKSSWIGVGKAARKGYNADKPYSLTVVQEAAGANAELEPNDELVKATPLRREGYREGFISPKTDVDYYVLRTDTPILAKVSLAGVERLDLALSIVAPPDEDGKPEKVLFKVNEGLVKEPEYLNNFACASECWLKVEGALKKVDGKLLKDYENSETPYRLTVTTVNDTGQEEREPNNTAETATPLTMGKAVRGTVHPKKDVDQYRLDLSGRSVKTPIKASVLGILKVDVGLYLYRMDEEGKPSLVQTADRGKADAPEIINYTAEPGIYLLEVRDAKNREANFQDSYQLQVNEGE